jgi:fibronectin-binding autotransporter adhesin
MKPKYNPFLSSAALASSIMLTFGAAASAGTLYWDGNGAGATGNPPTTNVGGTGTWDLTNTRWWNGTAYQTWNASGGLDIADFRVAAGTITVDTNTSANRLTFMGINSSIWILANSGGAVLTLNNTGSPTITFSSAIAATGNQKLLITGQLAGTVYLGGSFTTASSTSTWVGISGNNTGVTSTTIGEGTSTVQRINIASAAALGNAGATVSVSSNSQLWLDITAASAGVTFNAWDTTLAANSWLRVRNAGITAASTLAAAKSTYAGNIGLTGNAMISVRSAAGNALDLTGTVNTGVHSLTLASGDGSAGIDLTNTLSGSGEILIAGNSTDGITTGAGVVKLSADNSFTGTATTTIGTLALNHLNALDSATLDTGASAATNSVTFTVAGTNTYNIGGLAGSDALAIGANTISLGAKAGSFSFGGDISGGGGLTKVGSSSTQVLGGTNSYAGLTTVNAGELRIASANALNGTSGITVTASGAGLSLNGGISVGSGKTITINGTGIGSFNSFGALTNNGGDNTWEGNVTIGSAASRIGSLSGNLTVSGVIDSGAAVTGLTVRLTNSTTNLTLTNANTYLGDTLLITSGGALILDGGNDRLPVATNLILGASTVSGILDLNGRNQEVAGISVNSGTTNEIRSATSATLTVNSSSADSTFGAGGSITGSVSLVKEGGNRLTLAGTNTYTGATTVNNGTLALGAAGSINNSSGVALGGGTFDVSAISGGYTVNNLTGNGNVLGSITVSTELAIGASPGTVTFGDDLTLDALSVFNYEFTSGDITADLGIVSGNLTLTDGTSLNLFQLGTYTLNETFTLFAYSNALAGTFDGLAEGATTTDNLGGLWRINYGESTAGANFSNDPSGLSFVNITAIPEPSTTLLAALGVLALLRRRRA